MTAVLSAELMSYMNAGALLWRLQKLSDSSNLGFFRSHFKLCEFPLFLFCCLIMLCNSRDKIHFFFFYCRYLNVSHSDCTADVVSVSKAGRHLVFYYRGTVSAFFLFESVTQEMRDLHRAPSQPSPRLSHALSTFLKCLVCVSLSSQEARF